MKNITTLNNLKNLPPTPFELQKQLSNSERIAKINAIQLPGLKAEIKQNTTYLVSVYDKNGSFAKAGWTDDYSNKDDQITLIKKLKTKALENGVSPDSLEIHTDSETVYEVRVSYKDRTYKGDFDDWNYNPEGVREQAQEALERFIFYIKEDVFYGEIPA